MTRAIDAVLFDFGGVFTASPFGAVEAMARDLGFAVEPFAEVMFGTYHIDGDHPWHQLERGEISFDAAREAIIALGQTAGMPVDPLDLLIRMAGSNLVREPMVQLLRDIKAAGYPVGIITNNVREFRDGWRALIPVDELIDAVFDSSELGVRKPDARIYRQALQQMGVQDASRAVFLDDIEANVAAARTEGMQGIRVDEDAAPAMAALRRLLQMDR